MRIARALLPILGREVTACDWPAQSVASLCCSGRFSEDGRLSGAAGTTC